MKSYLQRCVLEKESFRKRGTPLKFVVDMAAGLASLHRHCYLHQWVYVYLYSWIGLHINVLHYIYLQRLIIHILYTYFIGNMWFTKVDSNLLTLSYFLTVILTHSYCFLTVILPVVTVWSCLTCQWRLGTMEWQRTSTGSVSKLC